ncbi:uncharacterized protein C16orf78 homolog isoform X2 [Tupaia chinensis]|uniref:uncharacterized protein C16orf78 homolog isoform X2 n=1 Tax=Tupaia chinensis TaxID=246437 RepID=UPI0003C8D9FE|nr:uncharacterized protein C16orf78 homolog isoform X2 [Tupaia chinensis]
MANILENLKDLMPMERKSTWRTAEERRMSDLTRVLEWLERRKGKKKQISTLKEKPAAAAPSKASEKEVKKAKGILKAPGGKPRQELAPGKASEQTSRKDWDAVTYRRLYGLESKGKRLSMVPGSYARDGPRKSDADAKDIAAMEAAQRANPFRRQSSVLDPILQDTIFGNRRQTFMREWATKTPDSTYERKLKSLMEKGTEPKIETVRMLKPEEVLSCRSFH